MNMRFSRLATVVLVSAAVVLMAERSWAVYHGLGASKDEWGLKYDVEVSAAAGDMLTVTFTLADEGRLKPIYSIEVIAFSKQTDSQGGRAYDVKAPFDFKPTSDGKRVGQVQIRKEVVDRAVIRLLTLTVDGQRRTSGSYYTVPLKKYWDAAPLADSPEVAPSIASPPASKVTK